MGNDVDAPVDAVTEVDVDVAGWAEHGGGAVGRSPVCVRGGVRPVPAVGLDLDDSDRHAVGSQEGTQ